MKRNYIKIALRQFLRHKVYSFINLTGLAVSASCLLIMLYVKSEWSYDEFHLKADRLHRVWLEEKPASGQLYESTTTPLPLAKSMLRIIPEVEEACRVYPTTINIKGAEGLSNAETVHIVDPSFFKMFDFGLIEGSRSKPFPSVSSIIISKAVAKKYFGNTPATGKVMELEIDQRIIPFTVSGISEESPEESSIKFNLLISFENERLFFTEQHSRAWFQIFPETYVLLKNVSEPQLFESKFDLFAKEIMASHYKKGTYNLHLQPITDIHLNDKMPVGIEPISSPVYSYVLSAIGIIILLIACINFITLSIGRSTTRAVEVGVRKVLGAHRTQLMRQFWTETLIFTTGSVLAGLALAFLMLKPFNDLFQRHLIISFQPWFIVTVLCVMLFVALVSGGYPALVLSAFNPAQVLKGKLKTAGKGGLLRQSLVATQFIASITMIICTLVISNQLAYMKNKNLGYKKEQVIVVPTNKGGKEGLKIAAVFTEELKKIPRVKSAAVSMFSMTEHEWANIGYIDDNKVYRSFKLNASDENFLNTMNIQLVAGRNFSKANMADLTGGMIVNEALVNEYGWTNPIGQKLPGSFPQRVIGVVKDFNYESLHSKILPLVLVLQPDSILRHAQDVSYSYSGDPRVSIRLEQGDLAAGIALISAAWKRTGQTQQFEYRFLDESLAMQYANEVRIGRLIMLASGLSIFIACIGLFGLATLVVTRRTKEIGIRKILGAHAGNILAMISKDFLITVCISAVIAFPLSWYAMNRWLESFEYRISVSWWMLAGSAAFALLITLVTVGIQALRASWDNPVKSLRTE